MADTTRAQVIMRTRIKDKISKTFEQDAVLLDMFLDGKVEKNNTLGTGIAAYTNPNGSLKALTEADFFPIPAETTDVLMKVFSVDWAKTGHISGRLLDIPDDLMLESALSLNTKRDTLTFKKQINRLCYGDGTGSLGTVTAITTGASGTATFGGAIGSSQIIIGQRVNFYTPAGIIHITGAAVSTVTDNNLATGVVTFDSVPTNAIVTDILVPEASYGLGLHGLAYHVNNDTGTYQGVTRSASLRATVIDASAAALSVALIDRMIRTMQVVAGVNIPMDDIVMISHPDQGLAYRTLGYALTRVVPVDGSSARGKFDLAFGQVSHMGLRWKFDIDCPRDRIYFLRLSSFITFMNRRPGLLIDENGDSLRLKPGTGVYAWDWQYEIMMSGDIGNSSPNSNGVIKNLALVA